MVTSKEKIDEILDWVQNTGNVDWSFMRCLKQDLETLVIIAQREGLEEAKELVNEIWNSKR